MNNIYKTLVKYKCKMYKVLNDFKILKPNRAETAYKYHIYLSIYLQKINYN